MAKNTDTKNDERQDDSEKTFLAQELERIGVDPDGSHTFGQAPVLDQLHEERKERSG
jgi:hypothetical protein